VAQKWPLVSCGRRPDTLVVGDVYRRKVMQVNRGVLRRRALPTRPGQEGINGPAPLAALSPIRRAGGAASLAWRRRAALQRAPETFAANPGGKKPIQQQHL
jgi:hypothetical protein